MFVNMVGACHSMLVNIRSEKNTGMPYVATTYAHCSKRFV
jgi:hypothetical protein